MRNSWKELEEEDYKSVQFDADRVQSGISAEIGIFRFIGEVVDLYFPKVVDLFVSLVGGTPSKPDDNTRGKSRYPDLN